MQREFETESAYPDRPPVFEEESDGQRGRIEAFLGLTATSYMKVSEWLVVDDSGRVQRESYSYALILDGAFAYGWERDPDTHPECPVHEHGPAPERNRTPSSEISLPAALREAWEMISLQAEAPP